MNLTPTKMKKRNTNLAGNDKIVDENLNDDDDDIVSSQSYNQSELKRKFKENVSKQSVSYTSSSTMGLTTQSPNTLDSCNIDIKEECIEINDNIDENSISTPLQYDESTVQNLSLDDPEPLSIEEEKPLKESLYINKKRNKKRKRNAINGQTTLNNFYEEKKNTILDNFSNNENSKQVSMANSLSEECVMKLKFLKIELQDKVPIQHTLERTAGTKCISKTSKKIFNKYVKMKNGRFSIEEDNIIKENWKKFCQVHNWEIDDTKAFLSMSFSGKCYLEFEERKNFVKFLANGLPERSLYSVYYRFRSLFTETNSGKYTKTEDRFIMNHMSNLSDSKIVRKCPEIARILNRKTHSIWNRFKKLNDKNCLKRENCVINKTDPDTYKSLRANRTNGNGIISWTYPMVQAFIYTLTKTSGCKLNDLKNLVIEQSIWNDVAKNLNIESKILQDFWYLQLHMQLFCPKPLYLSDLKIELIKYLHEQSEERLESIVWDTVCLKFDGVSPFFLAKLFEELIKYAGTETDSSKINHAVEYLYEEYIPKLKDKSNDIMLPKLFFKNNDIIGVDRGCSTKIYKITENPFSDEYV